VAATKQHQKTGGNKAVFDNLTKKGVSPSKAKSIAKTFRNNANKKKGG
jgi:hypothetical protein